jgi:hypothetical protein
VPVLEDLQGLVETGGVHTAPSLTDVKAQWPLVQVDVAQVVFGQPPPWLVTKQAPA